jgi:hypothetical protein
VLSQLVSAQLDLNNATKWLRRPAIGASEGFNCLFGMAKYCELHDPKGGVGIP